MHTFLSPPKEKCERPLGRPVPIRAGVGASSPIQGGFFIAKLLLIMQAGGFPRGKQSARPALPCVPLVVCLNSGSLTAFGGCIHWIPASLRSPLETFGSPSEAIKRPIRAASPSPAPGSARQSPPGQGVCACGRTGSFLLAPAPLFPSRRPSHEDHRPHRRHRLR